MSGEGLLMGAVAFEFVLLMVAAGSLWSCGNYAEKLERRIAELERKP